MSFSSSVAAAAAEVGDVGYGNFAARFDTALSCKKNDDDVDCLVMNEFALSVGPVASVLPLIQDVIQFPPKHAPPTPTFLPSSSLPEVVPSES